MNRTFSIKPDHRTIIDIIKKDYPDLYDKLKRLRTEWHHYKRRDSGVGAILTPFKDQYFLIDFYNDVIKPDNIVDNIDEYKAKCPRFNDELDHQFWSGDAFRMFIKSKSGNDYSQITYPSIPASSFYPED